MILKALVDYYERCDNLIKKGLELKEIGFLFVIEKDGTFNRIESRMIDTQRGTSFCVLHSVNRSGDRYIPNYFWDNYEYIVGGEGKSKKKQQTFICMVEKYNTILPNNDYINAILKFYQKYNNIENIIESEVLYEKLKKSNKNISFLLNGYTHIAAEDKDIINKVLSTADDETNNSICLITGINSPISRLHTKIKLTKDTGPLVSFQKNCGYDSYGKKQGYNAPISNYVEFAYSTALNHLLRIGSKNKFTLGSRTFLFWAARNNDASKQAEESLWSMLGFQENDDDPNRRILQVREVFNSIYSGQLTTSLEDKFYILGLAPNSARIAVSYWAEIPLKEFASMILKHFYDMDIIYTRKEKKPYFGLRSILSSVTLGGKVSDVTPNLPEALVKSIFQGLPYPQTLYSSCIRRIRAENTLGIARAAIIKAYLNRVNENQEKLNTMLDKENKNQGYLCGRLFAVLDKIQGDANGQRSIKERYMNAASATPATVFATIINLSSHHSEKLNDGRKVYFEKLKQEIVDKISAEGFPSHLDLQDQGRFFVGFYHQQQDFYIKKEELNNDHE